MALRSVRVLHRHAYVDIHHVAKMIRAIPRVCATESYLECVVVYNEAAGLCSKFAESVREPELRDPFIFLERVDTLEADAT